MKWIKCSDELPEIDKDVLCIDLIKNMKVGKLDQDSLYPLNKSWITSDYHIHDFDEITHWMPLPEIPNDLD